MNRRLIMVCTAGLVGGIVALGQNNDGAQSATSGADKLASMAWIEGCWAGPFENGNWEACYSSTTGGHLLSVNKELAGSRVKMIEFEHFVVKGDDVILTPYPNAKKSVGFKWSVEESNDTTAVFTNPEHDFPKRITYRHTDDDELHITVTADGRGFEMTLARKKP